MKIAILGANGFLGTRAVEYFTLSGQAEVRPIIKRFAGLARLSRFRDLDCKLADATDEQQLSVAFNGCDTVLHAINGNNEEIARCATPAYRAAERAGVKCIVFISSAAIYGDLPVTRVDEKTPVSAESLKGYALAKYQADQEFLKLGAQGNVRVVVLRPSIIVGPRSWWIADPTKQLLSGHALLGGGGTGFCNTIYIDNLLDAILLAAGNQQAMGEAFVLRDNESVTWVEYYRKLADLIGASHEVIVNFPFSPAPAPRFGGLPAKVRSYPAFKAASIMTPMKVKKGIKQLLKVPPIPEAPRWEFPSEGNHALSPETAALHLTPWKIHNDKAQAVLGYRPAVSLDEALKRSVAWLRFAGWI